MYEVEFKFALGDVGELTRKVIELGGEQQSEREQTDRYFEHPVRDFGDTDEALRIRSSGDKNVVTYKGPIVDSQSKTRKEIEIPFVEGTDQAARFAEILTTLDFREVHTVHKVRTPWHLQWEDRNIELTIDRVTNLGEFVELEAQAEESDLESTRDALLRLLQKLGFDPTEQIRLSYLCLLLEKRRG